MNLLRNYKLYLLGVPLETSSKKIIEYVVSKFEKIKISKFKSHLSTFYIDNTTIMMEHESSSKEFIWINQYLYDDLTEATKAEESELDELLQYLIMKKFNIEIKFVKQWGFHDNVISTVLNNS